MKTKIPEFKISSKLLKRKLIEVRLNRKAFSLVCQFCNSYSLSVPLEEAKKAAEDQHHYVKIDRRQIPEMRQILKKAVLYIQKKTASKTKCCFWTITEKNLKIGLKHLN